MVWALCAALSLLTSVSKQFSLKENNMGILNNRTYKTLLVTKYSEMPPFYPYTLVVCLWVYLVIADAVYEGKLIFVLCGH